MRGGDDSQELAVSQDPLQMVTPLSEKGDSTCSPLMYHMENQNGKCFCMTSSSACIKTESELKVYFTSLNF